MPRWQSSSQVPTCMHCRRSLGAGQPSFRTEPRSPRTSLIWLLPHVPQDIKTSDWSEEVAPFWDAVMWSALSWQGLAGLFQAGWKTIKVSVRAPALPAYVGHACVPCSHGE